MTICNNYLAFWSWNFTCEMVISSKVWLNNSELFAVVNICQADISDIASTKQFLCDFSGRTKWSPNERYLFSMLEYTTNKHILKYDSCFVVHMKCSRSICSDDCRLVVLSLKDAKSNIKGHYWNDNSMSEIKPVICWLYNTIFFLSRVILNGHQKLHSALLNIYQVYELIVSLKKSQPSIHIHETS